MNQGDKLTTGVIVAGLIILAVFGYSKYSANKIKSASQSQKNQSLVRAAPPSETFQPEGQMLTQAMNAEVSVKSTSTMAAAIAAAGPDHPASAPSNLPPYKYDPGTCKDSPIAYVCLADYYKNLTADYGSTIAIADIKQRYNDNPIIVSDCHPLMHVIGRTASNSYATVAEAFTHGDVFCWSGYYHGILEGVVEKIGLSALPGQLNTICADIPGKATYDFNYYNCVHGLGHGIMALLGDDVFKSLTMCDDLNGDWEDQSCYSGVFMQNIIDTTNVADTGNVVKNLKPSDPLYPCDAVDTKYKNQCYLGQTSYALQVTNYDYNKVFALCATVEDPFRGTCNQSMGRDVANQAYHQAARTKQLCSLAPTATDYTNCVIGAVKEIISYYHAETQALGFCNILDDPDKTNCINTADQYYKLF